MINIIDKVKICEEKEKYIIVINHSEKYMLITHQKSMRKTSSHISIIKMRNNKFQPICIVEILILVLIVLNLHLKSNPSKFLKLISNIEIF